MGTLVRLYVGWRLLRLLRPIVGAAVIAAAVLALYGGHVAVKTPASSPLLRGAAAAQHDLSRALKRLCAIATLTTSDDRRHARWSAVADSARSQVGAPGVDIAEARGVARRLRNRGQIVLGVHE